MRSTFVTEFTEKPPGDLGNLINGGFFVVEPEVALKDLDFDNDGLKISLEPEVKAALIK